MTDEEAHAIRAAQTQALFRQVNERIEILNDSWGPSLPGASWVCECADAACFETMSLTVAEYEAIRKHPDRFPVLRGHVDPEVEVVVEEHDAYVVVQKVGAAGEYVRRHDPRRAAS